MSTACRGWLPLTLILLLMLPSVPFAADPRPEADQLLDAEAPSIADIPLFSGRLLAEFYRERDHRNAWDKRRAEDLLTLAKASIGHGLAPADFHAATIRALLEEGALDSSDDDARTRSDILLSDALLRYLHHLQYGKYNPQRVNRGENFVNAADAEDLKAEMHAALAAPDLAQAVAGMLPEAPFYENLKRGYQRYLALAERGGFEPIPGGPNLKLGMHDARVPSIREHLAVTEGLTLVPGAEPKRYDEALVDAVKAFQRRSGLAADGVIGPNTLRALNEPLDTRLAMIRANLERMRWLYHELPPDYVFVDVAAFRLEVVRDHKPVWETRTVVGTIEDQTPMFRDEMEHLVFNPTWAVPRSIQQKMGRVGSKYHVIDRRTGRRVSASDVSDTSRYRVVQPAGPGNALGQVKFMFPNGHAIYLHDTPSRGLFARSTRAYSHGCVRVQEPLTLARQILNKPNWDDAEIERVVNRGRTRYVHLDDHLEVLLYYLTAVADDDGRVGFRRDIYQRDRPLLAALEEPAHAARIAFREPEPEEGTADVADAQPAGPADVVVETKDADAESAGDQAAPGPLAAATSGLSASEPAAPSTTVLEPAAAGEAGTADDEAPLAAPSVAASPLESGQFEPSEASLLETGGATGGAATAGQATGLAASSDHVERVATPVPPSTADTEAQSETLSPADAAVAADSMPGSSNRTDDQVSEQAADRTRATVAEPVTPRPAVPSRPFIDQELFGPAVDLKPLLPDSLVPQG